MSNFAVIRSTLLAALFFALGCASDKGDPTSEVKSAIQDGANDNTHKYAVGVCGGFGPGACNVQCSGTLIAPNLVMTARHCVDNIVPEIGPEEQATCADHSFGAPFQDNTYVTTNVTLRANSTGWYSVQQILRRTDTSFCGNDVVLLVLSQNVADVTQFAIPAIQYAMTDRTRFSSQYSIVGYGATAANKQDYGTRRTREHIPLLCIQDSPRASEGCGGKGLELLASEFATETGTCNGDSGGAAFEQVNYQKDYPVALGLLSRGGSVATQCALGIYLRLDRIADFLLAGRKTAASLGGYPEPDWSLSKLAAQDPNTIPTDETVGGAGCQLQESTRVTSPTWHFLVVGLLLTAGNVRRRHAQRKVV